MTTKSRIALATITAAVAIGTPPADAAITGDADFGDALVGSTVTRTYTIANDSPTWGIGIVPTVAGSSAFKQAHTTCSTLLLPSGTCSLTVSFKPADYSDHQGAIDLVAWSFVGSWTERLSLSGRGANVSISAGDLTFGDQPVGTIGTARQVSLTAAQSFTVTRARVVGPGAGDFFVSDDGCVGGPATNACVVSARFAPAALGARAAELVVTTSAGERRVALSGNGVAPPAPGSGPAGASGTNGAEGAQGAKGDAGPQGPSGQAGVTTTTVVRLPPAKARTASKKRCKPAKRGGRKTCAKKRVVKKPAKRTVR